MLTVTLDSSKHKLNIQSAYPYGTRIKQLFGAKWNPAIKMWQVPRECLLQLISNFKGELYFKTPLWEIKGEPAPDVIGDYELDARIKLPEMRLQLYPYQQYGAKFMIDRLDKHRFVINADGCGLGKTPQTIASIKWYVQNRGVSKILLVVKKSIKTQWAQEISKFSDIADTHTVITTEESKKKRENAYKAAKAAEKVVLVTNYHNFLNDTAMIKEIGFDFAVVDEAHCVKSKDGIMNNNIAKVIKNVPTVFLTGTPIMSRPGDIFGIISMSDPYYFNRYVSADEQWDAFKSRYIVTNYSYGHENVIGAKHLDELRDFCQQVTIRRTINEVAISMPDVVEKLMTIQPDELQKAMQKLCLTDEQDSKETYDSYEGRNDDYSSEQKFKLQNYMKGLTAIKQVMADDPSIMRLSKSSMVKKYAKEVPSKYSQSPKTEAILDTVSEILDSGEKVILFSRFMTVGKYISSKIESTLKVKTLMYTGDENQEERDKNTDLFRHTPDHNILIGTDAMAEGLNLEQARHIINIDLPDTNAIYAQRVGRARRVSSEYSTVIVYNFVTAESYDMNRLANLNRTKNLDDALVSANAAQSKALAKVSN